MALDAGSIESWIRKVILGGPDDQPLTKLLLRHVQAGSQKSGGHVVHTISVRDEADPAVLASELLLQIEADAPAFGGVQTYAIQCFFGGSEDPAGRKTVRIDMSRDNDEEVGASEEATEKGLAAMLMRHLEAKERISIMKDEAQARANHMTITQLTTMNKQLLEGHSDLIAAQAEMSKQKADAEIRMAEAMQKAEMKERGFALLAEHAAPVILPKIMRLLTGLEEAATEPVSASPAPQGEVVKPDPQQ